ncbi:methylamine utilization protein [Pleionea sediminis]|uniref:methylamine utilization protein n=1 Tax=Pleionea sediminis TaxID=2569479 RepID=UPI0011863F99|nr:methylamine utilization protein [Pleionea sediminis]
MIKYFFPYLFIYTFQFSPSLVANDLIITVYDQNKKALPNTVVKLLSNNSQTKPQPQKAIIDQVNKEYVPQVIAITQGSKVTFPNKDNIKHHVYSFSDAKPFELPLYEGTPANPVVFDNPGIVVLGCNIHDWMRGYIYVSDSPYIAITNESGKTSIKNFPDGNYQLELWHPQIKGDFQPVDFSFKDKSIIEKAISITLKPMVKIRRPKGRHGRRYEE